MSKDTHRPRLLDCRKDGRHMSSLSFRPIDGGLRGHVAAHEGAKPVAGDYLALSSEDGKGDRLYRVVDADWCLNVDPMDMWMATVEFVPGRVARTLDLPEMTRR